MRDVTEMELCPATWLELACKVAGHILSVPHVTSLQQISRREARSTAPVHRASTRIQTVANNCPARPATHNHDKMAPAQPELKKVHCLRLHGPPLRHDGHLLTNAPSTSTSGCLCSSTEAARSLASSEDTMCAPPFPYWPITQAYVCLGLPQHCARRRSRGEG
jgi:hypothetical protein